MKKLTRTETADFLQEHDHFVLLTHRRPDGDTIGSSAALCRILRNMGKTAYVLENKEVTPRYAWLHVGLTKKTVEEHDTLISVDVAAPNMLPEEYLQYLDRISLRIDHHSSATSFTEAELVDHTMGACGEIIYDLMMELWEDIDETIADALYVAVSTDTGCFRFSNTSDHSFLVAAACARGGAGIYRLNQTLFETNSLARLKIQSWIVENMHIFGDGRLAVVAIPKEVEESIGVTEDDMDNITSFPRTIEGICMAATLRQTKDGRTKISVRAVPGYDATVIAACFGGGGHKGAAGASTDTPIFEAARQIQEEMMKISCEVQS